MKVNKEKLSNASTSDILQELSFIREELSNEMYPSSWARTEELLEYAGELYEELSTREQNKLL